MQREIDSIALREVLYVEDHPTNVHLMQALFKRRPQLELVVARDGREARRVAAHLQPALLLLDSRLPDCHGTTLLMQLRELTGWADIPAVAVTAEPDFDAGHNGFCEVWAKPLDLAFLLERLDHLTASMPTRSWPHLGVALRPLSE